MALEDFKINDDEFARIGAMSLPKNKYVGEADLLKKTFDDKPNLIKKKFNDLIDGLKEEFIDGEGVTKIVVTDTEPTAETQTANPTTLYLVVE